MSDVSDEFGRGYPNSELDVYDEVNDSELATNSEEDEKNSDVPHKSYKEDSDVLPELAVASYISCRAEMISKAKDLDDENILPTIGVVDYLMRNGFDLADVKPYEIAVLEILIDGNPLCLRVDGFKSSEKCFIPLTLACFGECQEKFRIPKEILRPMVIPK